MRGGFWAVAGLLLVVALVATLVRPGAQTANVVTAIGRAGGQLISSAEGA